MISVLELTRLDCVYVEIDVSVTLKDGTTAIPAVVGVAVLPVRSRPTADTVWTTPDYSAGTATVLLAGPDAAASAGVLIVSGDRGGDLWVLVTDVPEVQAVQAARISVS